MTPAKRQTALCLAIIAYALTAVCAPAGTVLCVGTNGHIAIEPEHDGCCSHARGNTAATMIKSADPVVPHCCCIDIPLPGANPRPCTVDLHKPLGDAGRAHVTCAGAIEAAARARPAPLFQSLARASDSPTATIVLLI